jgi:predicted RecB family nuclease
MNPITASMLYDLVQCPHRPWRDLFGNAAERDEVSAFVKLLWERGACHERRVVEALAEPFVDLSGCTADEKEARTIEAMASGATLIYSGRIRHGELLGEPDLLRLEGEGYVPGDIKSGAGEEGDGDSAKPKKHYGVQLALYADILERLGRSAGRRGFIWDVHGREILYDLEAPLGPRSPALWAIYQEHFELARRIVQSQEAPSPASSAECKQCWWYSSCHRELRDRRDLTLVPELGRSKRDLLRSTFPSYEDLARANPNSFSTGKDRTSFQGMGLASLRKFVERSKLLCDKAARPYLKQPIEFPSHSRELFFDIEVDPMRDVCYLHCFVERVDGEERYHPFFADSPTPEMERKAFSQAWAFVQGARPCAIYFYSKYERTIWRKLQGKYPEVCSADEIEYLIASPDCVDLYFDVVRPHTEWPTNDFSIKTLAKHLGFKWRDAHPSGAASIEWYDRWVTDEAPELKARLLQYNEDDCVATRVLLDGIKNLNVRP